MFTYPIVSSGGIEINEQSWYAVLDGSTLRYGTMTSSGGWTQIASAAVPSLGYSLGVSGNYFLIGYAGHTFALYQYDGTSTLAELNTGFAGPGATGNITYMIRGDKKNPGYFFLSNEYGATASNGGIGYVTVNGSNTLDEVDYYVDPAGATRRFNLTYVSSAPEKIATRADQIWASPDYLTAKNVFLQGDGAAGLTVLFESGDVNYLNYNPQSVSDPLTNRIVSRFDFSERDVLTYRWDPVDNVLREGAYRNNDADWDNINGWGLWNDKLLVYPVSGAVVGDIEIWGINADGTITYEKSETPGSPYTTCTGAYDVCPYTGIIQVVTSATDTVLLADKDHNISLIQSTGVAVDTNFYSSLKTQWLPEALSA